LLVQPTSPKGTLGRIIPGERLPDTALDLDVSTDELVQDAHRLDGFVVLGACR
jgi:hypothetical protein